MNPQETPKPNTEPVNPTIAPQSPTQPPEHTVPRVTVGGQSESEIAAQSAVVNPSVNPSNAAATPTSPFGPSPKATKQGLIKKLIILGAIALVVIVLSLVLFLVLHKTNSKNDAVVKTSKTNSASSAPAAPSGFKTINYTSTLAGTKTTFQLTFYSSYTQQGNSLNSNVDKNGLYPLQLNITAAADSNSIEQQLLTTSISCYSDSTPDLPNDNLQIKNTATGYTVNMCGLNEDNTSSLEEYMGVLKSGSNYYGIQVLQNEIGSTTTLNSNLQAYNSDIEAIVSSIKVVSSSGSSQSVTTPSASTESSNNVFTSSGSLEPTDYNSSDCGSTYSQSNTFVGDVAVSGTASCTDAENVISDATTSVNGGSYSGYGYKCTSAKDGVGYKYQSRWQEFETQGSSTFYSYNCKDGSNQIAFNWRLQ